MVIRIECSTQGSTPYEVPLPTIQWYHGMVKGTYPKGWNVTTAISAERTPSESTGNVTTTRKTTIPVELGNALSVLTSRFAVIIRHRVTYQELAEILEYASDEQLTEMASRYTAMNGATE